MTNLSKRLGVKQLRKRGRPITRKVEIHATAEEIAMAIFAAAKPPDPSLQIVKRPRPEKAR